MTTRRPGILLDRDGTIIVDHGYVGSVDRVEFIDGAADAIATFNRAGIPVAVVTNQAGVARGLYGIDYSLKDNLTVHDFMHHEREVVDMERLRILKNLEQHHIELVRGQAAFVDAHTVSVTSNGATRQLPSRP